MIDKLELGSIDIMTPLGGGALQLPNGLWEPGSLSAHKGHFGVGATAIPFTAALVAGPAITSPLTFNSIGLNNHVGIYNVTGAHIKVGTNISLGALEAAYNAVSQKITGLFSKITPAVKEVTPKSTNVAPAGSLAGFWNYNGKPLDLLHIHSDIRLKKNIKRLDDLESLNLLMELNPVSYEWKDDLPTSLTKNYPEGRQIGLIAQEVGKYIPSVVKDEPLYDKIYKGVDYGRLTTLLIGAVQEHQKEIKSLKERIAVLEGS